MLPSFASLSSQLSLNLTTAGAAVLVAALLLTAIARRRSVKSVHAPMLSLGHHLRMFTSMNTLDSLARLRSIFQKPLREHGLMRMWLGFPVYVLGDVAHMRQIALSPDVFVKLELSEMMPGTLAEACLGTNLVSSNGETWRRYRRVINPIFRRGWSPAVFDGCADDMMQAWMSKAEGKTVRVELHSWMSRLTLDVLGKAVLGHDFRALADGDSETLRLYTDVVRNAGSALALILPWLDRWWNPWRTGAWRSLRKFHAIIDNVIQEKRRALEKLQAAGDEVEDDEKDLLTSMLEACQQTTSSNDHLTNEELRGNTTIMFIAGHDTTASAMTAAVYLLAQHPEYQARLREELDQVLPHHDALPTATTKLPLLEAVIRESLRLYPPVQQLPMRELACDVELKFTSSSARRDSGHVTETLPKGARVMLHTLAIHRHPEVFPNPDAFLPERFLKGSELYNPDHAGFFAFSGGSRVCIGQGFSLLEQRVVLSKLLRRFKFSLPEDSIHKDEMVFDGLDLINPRNLTIDFTELA